MEDVRDNRDDARLGALLTGESGSEGQGRAGAGARPRVSFSGDYLILPNHAIWVFRAVM